MMNKECDTHPRSPALLRAIGPLLSAGWVLDVRYRVLPVGNAGVSMIWMLRSQSEATQPKLRAQVVSPHPVRSSGLSDASVAKQSDAAEALGPRLCSHPIRSPIFGIRP
jgi:hypothetical protein